MSDTDRVALIDRITEDVDEDLSRFDVIEVVDAVLDPANRDAVLRALGVDEKALGESITLLIEGQRRAEARAEAAEKERNQALSREVAGIKRAEAAERKVARGEAAIGESAAPCPSHPTVPCNCALARIAAALREDDA